MALGAALLALALLPEGSAPPPDCVDPHPIQTLAEGATIGAVRCGAGPPGARTIEGPARLLFGLPLDANRARAEWLEVLPGIGPSRAAAWVEERRRAPFCHVTELTRVSGIGPRTLARLAPWVSVAPSACGDGTS